MVGLGILQCNVGLQPNMKADTVSQFLAEVLESTASSPETKAVTASYFILGVVFALGAIQQRLALAVRERYLCKDESLGCRQGQAVFGHVLFR